MGLGFITSLFSKLFFGNGTTENLEISEDTENQIFRQPAGDLSVPGDKRYKYCRSLSAHEEKLRKDDFRFVHTNWLHPGGRLNAHAHNSENTHRIIFGEMRMHKPKDGLNTSLLFRAGQEAPVRLHECYVAVAGPQGCLFVEAHEQLSPTTAVRFMERGTLMVADPDDEGEDVMAPTEEGLYDGCRPGGV